MLSAAMSVFGCLTAADFDLLDDCWFSDLMPPHAASSAEAAENESPDAMARWMNALRSSSVTTPPRTCPRPATPGVPGDPAPPARDCGSARPPSVPLLQALSRRTGLPSRGRRPP